MNAKKFLSGLLSCALVGSIFLPANTNLPNDIAPAVVMANAATYDELTYTAYTDHVEITGCSSSAESVEIPEEIDGLPVTDIAQKAFADCSNLISVTMPDSITSIGGGVFYHCTSLKEVRLSASITSMPCVHDNSFGFGYYYYGFFEGCSSLESVVIPDGVKSLEEHTFEDCDALKSITIGAGLTSLYYIPIYSNKKLQEINVSPDNEKYSSIDGVLFSKDQTKLIKMPLAYNKTEYTIPDSVTSIESSAFYNSSNLSSITFGNNIEIIGRYAFQDTLWYENQPDGLVYAGTVAYEYKGEMPENTQITLKDGTLGIAENAFYNCDNMVSITLPDSVTYVGSSAFYSCDNLTSINIGAGLKTLNDIPYFGSSVKEINVSPDNENYSSIDGVLFNKEQTNIIYFPKGSEITEFEIPDSVTRIDGRQFYECSKLAKVIIPDSVTSIGSYAFAKSGLKSITIPDSVTSVGNAVFFECNLLEEVNLPANFERTPCNVDSRGYYSSYSMKNASAIEIPSDEAMVNGTHIYGTEAPPPDYRNVDGFFENCSSLKTVTMPKNMKSVGEQTFKGCISLESVEIPDSVTDMGGGVFYGCSSLKDVKLPDIDVAMKYSLEESNSYPYKSYYYGFFEGCTNLKTILHVGQADEYTFKECGQIESMTLNSYISSLENIPYDLYTMKEINVSPNNEYYSSINGMLLDKDQTEFICFPQNYEGTELIIPDSITSISYNMFNNYEKFTSIEIGAGLTSVNGIPYNKPVVQEINVSPDNEYYSSVDGVLFNKDVTKLIQFPQSCGKTEYDIPESVTNIGDEAFYSCSDLTSITIPSKLESIGDKAFYDCSDLTSIDIPDGVTSIGEFAFSGCAKLKSIKIPDSVTYVGDGVFSRCTLLKSAELSSNMTSIPCNEFNSPTASSCSGFFENCLNLENIQILESITEIGAKAFYGCDKMKSIVIPAAVTKIDEKAIGYTSSGKKIDTFKIYGTSDTEAENYALENGIIFVDVNNTPMLSRDTLSLKQGESYVLEILNYTGDVTWLSNNTDVATIKNGLVTAVAVGETTVYAIFGDELLKCTVSVSGNMSETTSSTITSTTVITTTTNAISTNVSEDATASTTSMTTQITSTSDNEMTTSTSTSVSTSTSTSTAHTNETSVITSTETPKVVIQQPYIGNLYVGNTFSINVIFNDYDGDLMWYSKTPSIASVTKEGKVTINGEGTAMLFAMDEEDNLYNISFSTYILITTTSTTTTTTTTTSSFVTTTTSTTTTHKPPTTTYPIKISIGDIDCDGTINALDASLALMEYAAIATGRDSYLTANQKKFADINKDGTIDAMDASLILGYYSYTATGGKYNIEEYLKLNN